MANDLFSRPSYPGYAAGDVARVSRPGTPNLDYRATPAEFVNFLNQCGIDHGSLGGNADDDHPQYHNDARGDARYFTQAQVTSALAGKSDTGHTHDSRYYTETETDALLAAKSDVTHDHDADYAPIAKGVTNGDSHDHVGGDGAQLDHGSFSGLGDNDHPQYALLDGSAAFTAPQAGVDPVDDDDFTTKSWVVGIVSSLSWRMPVLDKDLTAPPGGENIGDRYIVAATATGDWAGHEDDIAEVTSTGPTVWSFETPSAGWAVTVVDETFVYAFDTTNGWTNTGLTGSSDHGSLGGLGDDDHTQYHNDARGDARYYTQTQLDTDGVLDTRYYTETEADAAFAPIAKGVTNGDSHDHTGGAGAQLDHTTFTNIGSNTHDQIDTHIASSGNPHSVTAAQAGADPAGTAASAVSTHESTYDHDAYDSFIAAAGDIVTHDASEFATAAQGALADSALQTLPNAVQTVYVAANGDDGNDGLSPDLPKLTIGAALTAASALTPASDNIIVVRGDDAAEYAEDITVPRYVIVDMPNAHLLGGVSSTSPDAGVRFHRITKSTSGNAVLLNSATAGQFWVDVDRIDVDGTANALACAQAAELVASIKTIVNGGTGYGAIGITAAPGHIHLEAEDIYLSSTGYAVGLAVAGTLQIHAKHILNLGAGAGTAINADAGTIYLNCNHINVAVAWDIESGATVYLDCDKVEESGSSANDGTLYDWKTLTVTALQPGADDADIAAAASPANYTPTGATVEGHLEGIDDAFGALPGGHDPVTVNDSDTIDLTLSTQDLTAAARVQMSITSDASGLKLSGDEATPGNNKVYGTDGTGTKGWKDDLGATAVQPGDIGTAAAEDVGYFATAAQGGLADSAVQPGDNVSDLVNDAGYVTSVTTSARDMFKIPYAISDTNPPSAAVQASATYTLTNNPSPGDTVTLSDDNCVGSFVITFDTDVAIGGDIPTTVTNLVTYLMTGAGGLNYFSTPCTFNDNGADFEVTAWVAGDHLNTYRVTFDIAAGNPTNNGDALSGGVTGLSCWNRPPAIAGQVVYSTGPEQASLEQLPASPYVSVNFNYSYPGLGAQRCHFLANTTDPLTLIQDNQQGSGIGMPFQIPVAPSWQTSEVATADNNTMIMYPALYETGKDADDPEHYEYAGLFHANFKTFVNGVTPPSARILYSTSSRVALNAGNPYLPRSYWYHHPMGLGHTNFAYTDPDHAWNGAALYPTWPTAAQLPCIPYSVSELQEDTAINRVVPVAIGGNMMAHESNVGGDEYTVVHPASGRDADHGLCSGYVPYGGHLVIDQDFDIDAWCDAQGDGAITRKVLHGLQDWGCIVVDIGGLDGRLDFWIDNACDSSTRSELQTQVSAFRAANPDAFRRITNTAATQMAAGGSTPRVPYFIAPFTGTPGTGHNPGTSTGGGAVSSVFGRAGAVTQQVGDYTSVQITQADGASDIVVGYPIWLDPDDTTGATNYTRGVEQIAAGKAAGAEAFSLMPAGGYFVYDGTFDPCGPHTSLDGDGGSGDLIEGIPLFANGCTLAIPSSPTLANFKDQLSPVLNGGGTDYLPCSDFFVNDTEPYQWSPGAGSPTKASDTLFGADGSDYLYPVATDDVIGLAKHSSSAVMTRLLQVSRLDYDGETVTPTGTTAVGATSGATARVVRIVDNGTDGELWLTSIKGTFEDDETVNLFTVAGAAAGTVVANGAVDPYPTSLADDEWALDATPGIRVGTKATGDYFWIVTDDSANICDQGGRLLDKKVFLDLCGTARFHVVGPLTLVGQTDQPIIAIATSRQGPKDSRTRKSGGRENVYDNITLIDFPIGLATTPIGGAVWDATSGNDEDGQIPSFSAATFGHLAMTNVLRPMVFSSNRADSLEIKNLSTEGVRARSHFHSCNIKVGPWRGVFSTAASDTVSASQAGHDEPFCEFSRGDYILDMPYMQSGGSTQATSGAYGFFHIANAGVRIRGLKPDNVTLRTDRPYLVVVDDYLNGFSRGKTSNIFLDVNENVDLLSSLTSIVHRVTHSYTGGTRDSANIYVRMPMVEESDVPAITLSGGNTIADQYFVEQRDTKQHYRVVAGALVTCDGNGVRHSVFSTDPTASSDEDLHYGVGSRWINDATGREFICVDPSPGGAVWTETTETSGAAGIVTTSTSSGAAWTSVSGSEVNVEAGRTYSLRWKLRTYSAVTTTGLGLRRVLAGGATGSILGWHALAMNNSSNVSALSSREGTIDAFVANGNSADSTSSSGSATAECVLVCTSSGTIGLEMTTEVDTSLVTIDGDGSYVEWRSWKT